MLQLHYTFNRLSMLQEPLLVVGFFFLLFLTAIIYVRLDFSLTKVRAADHARRCHDVTMAHVRQNVYVSGLNSSRDA